MMLYVPVEQQLASLSVSNLEVTDSGIHLFSIVLKLTVSLVSSTNKLQTPGEHLDGTRSMFTTNTASYISVYS